LRKTIEISTRSEVARQAYLSRISRVEDKLAEAFMNHQPRLRKNVVEARLFAGVTLAMMNAAIVSWYMGKNKSLEGSAAVVLKSLASALCESDRARD
jgi:hypothetical protein